MKYALETGSDVMTYIPRFIKNMSGIQKLMGGHTDTQTYREDINCIRLDRLERILTMVYVVQNYWAYFGLYPSSCMWKM
jgi:hypothetical protein